MITFRFKNGKEQHYQGPNKWSSVAAVGRELESLTINSITIKNRSQADYMITLLKNADAAMIPYKQVTLPDNWKEGLMKVIQDG